MATMASRTKTRQVYVPAREAKNRFGELLEAVQRHPVFITKNNRVVAEIRRSNEKSRFEEMEDQIWLEKVLKAEKTAKFLGVAETKKFLDKYRA